MKNVLTLNLSAKVMLGYMINTARTIYVRSGNFWKKKQNNQKVVFGLRVHLFNLGSIGG
jgi:hypothetical protein